MPAIPAYDFLKPQEPKRQIRSRAIPADDFLKPQKPKRQIRSRQSFFVKTAVEWNHLDTEVVHAETV